ncbi:uncharacterized protein LOC120703661 [Panicum virgatum]|uniref:Uncharacterized protein n=1 Tax=Panicum virgatum TaxID=38727 RepID=A0A8T0TW61_PANVG|nr:uncharacterized protein LOC120703661 [Panicum virgatum]KAG2612119.1 hypothetical protein PVAP13_4KG240805 [Panicum virgatum]
MDDALIVFDQMCIKAHCFRLSDAGRRWLALPEYGSLGKASSSVMCLVLYPMFVGEMSIWQWVSQALRKLASVLDKQLLQDACSLYLQPERVSFSNIQIKILINKCI